MIKLLIQNLKSINSFQRYLLLHQQQYQLSLSQQQQYQVQQYQQVKQPKLYFKYSSNNKIDCMSSEDTNNQVEDVKKNQNIEVTIFNNQLSPLSMYYVTVNSIEQAQSISSSLVENKLAACVNILGTKDSPMITSVYFWEGKSNMDSEYLLIIKSRTLLLQEIVNHVKSLHSYDVPEIIGTPIFAGNKAYIDWVFANTKEPQTSQQQ